MMKTAITYFSSVRCFVPDIYIEILQDNVHVVLERIFVSSSSFLKKLSVIGSSFFLLVRWRQLESNFTIAVSV